MQESLIQQRRFLSGIHLRDGRQGFVQVGDNFPGAGKLLTGGEGVRNHDATQAGGMGSG